MTTDVTIDERSIADAREDLADWLRSLGEATGKIVLYALTTPLGPARAVKLARVERYGTVADSFELHSNPVWRASLDEVIVDSAAELAKSLSPGAIDPYEEFVAVFTPDGGGARTSVWFELIDERADEVSASATTPSKVTKDDVLRFLFQRLEDEQAKEQATAARIQKALELGVNLLPVILPSLNRAFDKDKVTQVSPAETVGPSDDELLETIFAEFETDYDRFATFLQSLSREGIAAIAELHQRVARRRQARGDASVNVGPRGAERASPSEERASPSEAPEVPDAAHAPAEG